jgi:flagellar protein FlgJ
MAAAPVSAVSDFGQFAKLRAGAKAQDPAALQKVAKQFESLFTEMLLKSADATKVGDDLTGTQGDFYKDLYNQQMSVQLSSGKGLGLADMLVKQLGGHANTATSSSGLALPKTAAAQTSTSGATPSAQDFVASVRPEAEKAAAALGVPARVLIAQAALETGWGKHVPKQADGSSGFNLFGVKAGSSWSGSTTATATKEFDSSGWNRQTDSFRSYGSIGHAFSDFVSLMKNNPRYSQALSSGSATGFAYGLQHAGYATDPDYAQKLLKVANSAEMTAALTPSSTNKA